MQDDKLYTYRILGNFRGKIILMFLQICLQPNYGKMHCSVIINDDLMAILENLFAKGTLPSCILRCHQKDR